MIGIEPTSTSATGSSYPDQPPNGEGDGNPESTAGRKGRKQAEIEVCRLWPTGSQVGAPIGLVNGDGRRRHSVFPLSIETAHIRPSATRLPRLERWMLWSSYSTTIRSRRRTVVDTNGSIRTLASARDLLLVVTKRLDDGWRLGNPAPDLNCRRFRTGLRPPGHRAASVSFAAVDAGQTTRRGDLTGTWPRPPGTVSSRSA
jgi:hypothetical protein